MRTWIIGSDGECDIVVAQPRVSRRHCRLTESADGHLLEDLGSSNGTYVNGDRIAAPARVSAGDRITLGALVPMPWPPASGAPGAAVLRIGRAPDNEIVIDDPRVSSHHARLLVDAAGARIEDASSSNGTFLNAPERRVTQAVPLADADTVYLGSMAVPAARLLPSRAALPTATAPAPVTSRSPWTLMMLAQAPVLGVLILVLGRTSGPIADEGVASMAFAMAIAAVWLGGSLAPWALLIGRDSSARMIAALGGLAVIQCAVLLAIVHGGGGLRGPWPAELGVLALASAVGLAMGWLVFSLSRRPTVAVSALILAFAAMSAMGGRIWRLPDSRLVAATASAMPTRWAFEGLLLLEDDRRGTPGDPVPDLAEPFFPTDSDRMGQKADAMALGFMLIGLAGASAFVSANGKAGHWFTGPAITGRPPLDPAATATRQPSRPSDGT